MNSLTLNNIKTPICIGLTLIALIGSQFSRAVEQDALVLDAVAPDFTLRTNQETNMRLADLRGEVVMINFWATWCGPCLQEMPLLDELYSKYEPAGFKILGINIEKDSEKAEKLAKELNVSFPILYDNESVVSKLYDVEAMPSTVFIDRDGNFRYLHKGFRPGDEDSYKKVIQALIRM